MLQRICRLSAVVVVLALAAGAATSGGQQVNEICVIGGDIHYCAPKDL